VAGEVVADTVKRIVLVPSDAPPDSGSMMNPLLPICSAVTTPITTTDPMDPLPGTTTMDMPDKSANAVDGCPLLQPPP